MKKILFLITLLCCSGVVMAQPLWLRYPSISHDGGKIVFTYKGDLYVVNSSGGRANQLTTGDSYESTPIWSPDGESIAFSSNRYGNNDVYIMSANGGEAKRITTNSYDELPLSFTADGKEVIFSSARISSASDRTFPILSYAKSSYAISINGGRERLITAMPSENTKMSKDGSLVLYEDVKGGEDKWRKHHTSSIARNIVLYNTKSESYKLLTDNVGEDRNPIFSNDEKSIFFLSAPEGKTINVYSMELDHTKDIKQISNFSRHAVRFLSADKNNKLCYGYHGEIYTQTIGSSPKKVNIEIVNDIPSTQTATLNLKGGISSSAISNDGSQVAFIIRGEVFVTSVDYGVTRRITNTSQAEKGLSFSKDGRTLLYSSDRNGVWNIYMATMPREADVDFATATLIEEEPLFKSSDIDRFNPIYSPDGKEIAYLENRNILMVYNIESKKSRKVTTGEYHYRNNTGGFSYQWSPDSKWFTLTFIANMHDPYGDIGIVSANGGKIYNITESGYMNVNPKWALNGEAVIYSTEKYGMRNHASWGSMNDVMIAFVNQDAYDRFQLSEKEYKLMKAEEKRLKTLMSDNEKPKGKDKNSDKKGEEREELKGIDMELETINERVIRLTPHSSSLGDMLISKDGTKLIYVMNGTLYEMGLRNKEMKSLSPKTSGSLTMDKDGKNIFIIGHNSISKMAANGGNKSVVPFNATMELDRVAEREYMFNTVYNEVSKRFYVENLHNTNWSGLKREYEPLLAHINNNIDFADMLSELLGELNASHTGSKSMPIASNYSVAELGLFFDESYTKDGLLISEVIEGGPFSKYKSKVAKGDIITKINGTAIKRGEEYYSLLKNMENKRILVSIKGSNGDEWEEIIKPLSKGTLSEILYKRWVKWQESEVERLSGGRLGYVHIRGMSDEHFRTIYSNILGKYNHCDAIIVDTRNNGGGRMHEDIEILFSGKKYLTQSIRGVDVCDMPSRRWNKPSIMLTNEANYSNAHGTPWVYQKMGLGRIVGMPVPGTMTSVNWERMQDNTLIYGIPVIGYRTEEGVYLENTQVIPDVIVYNTPEKILNNEDEQLKRAVEELLKEVDSKREKEMS